MLTEDIYAMYKDSISLVLEHVIMGSEQLATNSRHIFATNATLRPFLHYGHTEWVINYICDSRTNVARLSHELFAKSSSRSHTCCTTFMRQSCEIREMLARCSHNEIAHIYHRRLSHDVLVIVVRLSMEGRAIVARWLCEKMSSKKQQQHFISNQNFRL